MQPSVTVTLDLPHYGEEKLTNKEGQLLSLVTSEKKVTYITFRYQKSLLSSPIFALMLFIYIFCQTQKSKAESLSVLHFWAW